MESEDTLFWGFSWGCGREMFGIASDRSLKGKLLVVFGLLIKVVLGKEEKKACLINNFPHSAPCIIRPKWNL